MGESTGLSPLAPTSRTPVTAWMFRLWWSISASASSTQGLNRWLSSCYRLKDCSCTGILGRRGMRHSQRQILRLSLEKLCELLGSGQRGPPIDLKFLPSCCNPESHLASSMLREVLCNLGQGLNQDHRVRDRHMQLFSSTNPPAPGSNSAQCVLNRTAALHLRQAAQQISPFCISTRLVDGEELVQNRLSRHSSTCNNVLSHRFRERG